MFDRQAQRAQDIARHRARQAKEDSVFTGYAGIADELMNTSLDELAMKFPTLGDNPESDLRGKDEAFSG